MENAVNIRFKATFYVFLVKVVVKMFRSLSKDANFNR